jgi:hypothetical protein
MRNLNRLSRRFGKEPRALRPSQFLAKWREVEQENSQLRQTVTEQTQQLSANTADFFERVLGFKLFEYQKESLRSLRITSLQLPVGVGKAARAKPYLCCF